MEWLITSKVFILFFIFTLQLCYFIKIREELIILSFLFLTFKLYYLLTLQEEADANPDWYDHKCFVGMGDHYFQFDYTPDQATFFLTYFWEIKIFNINTLTFYLIAYSEISTELRKWITSKSKMPSNGEIWAQLLHITFFLSQKVLKYLNMNFGWCKK